MTTIRRIRIGEGALYRSVRLEALKEAPYAFSTTYESANGRALKDWNEQADSAAKGSSKAIFIALRDGKPVGISAIYRNRNKLSEAEVFQVWVHPEFRGQGAGTAIMDAVFNWAKETGCERLIATIASTNKNALGFYSRYGFEILPNHGDRSSPEVHLERLIALNRRETSGEK